MSKRIQARLIMQLHADGMSQDDIVKSRSSSRRNPCDHCKRVANVLNDVKDKVHTKDRPHSYECIEVNLIYCLKSTLPSYL